MGSGDGKKIVMLDFEEDPQDGVFDVTPNNGSANDWDAVNEDWQNSLDAAGQRQAGNVNVLRHDGSVSSESADDLITDHPASSPDDWVPWRLNGTKWVGSSDPEADIDRDNDGIANDQDNCPDKYNPSQGPCEGSRGTRRGYGTRTVTVTVTVTTVEAAIIMTLATTMTRMAFPATATVRTPPGTIRAVPDKAKTATITARMAITPNQTDTNGNGDYCDDYQETNCEFPMPELDGWHIHVKALSGGEADYPINDLNNPWVRLATDQPDDDCLVNIEIEDAGGTDFDSRVRLERLSDGNILLEYSWIAGDGTVLLALGPRSRG